MSEGAHFAKTNKVSAQGGIAKKKELSEGLLSLRTWRCLRCRVAKTNQLSEGADVTKTNELSEGADVTKTKELSEGADVTKTNQLSEGADVTKTKELSEGADVTKTKAVSRPPPHLLRRPPPRTMVAPHFATAFLDRNSILLETNIIEKEEVEKRIGDQQKQESFGPLEESIRII